MFVTHVVGGGGGVAGNAGTQGVGGKLTLNTVVGGSGGSGNHGGAVNVTYSGGITTGDLFQLQYTDSSGKTSYTTPIATGSGSHGIVAQSIGGGGGMGGSADPATSIIPDLAGSIIDDVNKILDAKNGIGWLAKKITDFDTEEFEFPTGYKTSVAVGGSGGAAGDGGAVQVAVGANSRIGTTGHRAYGVLAQSVGGGGGTGGVAAGDSLLDTDVKLSPITGADVDIGLNVGGASGNGGNGGDVTVTINVPRVSGQDYRLFSSGYASPIVVGQSIAGGGGIAHDGSMVGFSGKIAGAPVPDVKLGAMDSGRAGAGGNAGAVTLGTSSQPLNALMENAGDASGVLVAQSISGGGGIADFGCTNSGRPQGAVVASACFTNTGEAPAAGNATYMPDVFVNQAQSFGLTIQGSGNAGNAGAVAVNVQGAGLHTTGDRSVVVVAQSIGGGGGLAVADLRNVASTAIQPNGRGQGGAITLSFDQTSLTSSGHGSWGILAQSITSGGGLLGDTSADLLQPLAPSATRSGEDGMQAGDITVSLTDKTAISVGRSASVTNAHGMVLQSLGSGGGIQGGSAQALSAPLLAGMTGSLSSGRGGSIQVSIDASSSVETTAIGGIGIFAQSSGYYLGSAGNQGVLTVDVQGKVIGGTTGTNPRSGRTLDGIGILFSGGASSAVAGSANTITVDKGGVISTQGGTSSGYAIKVVDGLTNVTNNGTITGSIDLGATPGTVTNAAEGVMNKGPVYSVGGNSLNNYGTLNIGLAETVGTTTLDGRLNQYEGGRTVFTIDAANALAPHDTLVVNGPVNMAGEIQLHSNSLLPGAYPVLSASSLNFTGKVTASSWVFNWLHQVSDNQLSVRPQARFARAGSGLTGTAASLGAYLQRGWNAADASKGRVFGYLNQVQSLDHYRETLMQLGGQNLHAQPQQMLTGAYTSFSDSMACPVFQTPGLQAQGQGCVWARVSGNRTDQSAMDNNLGYRSEGGGLRLGVQRRLDANWTIGGTVGANLNRLTSDGFSSKGNMYDASVSLKRQMGNWSVTGALAMAYGSFRNDRTPQLGRAGNALGLNATYSSRSSMTLLGARLRAAYDFTWDASYLRPYLDVDIMHTRSPSFSESGSGPLGLAVGAVNKTSVAVTPMLELGTRYDVNANTVLRAYAGAGVSFLPNNQRVSQNSFVGALSTSGTFESRNDGPSAVGRLNLGVQVINKNGLEISAEYGLQAGSNYRSQNISAQLNYRF
ncbi:MAG: autotransporter domain-containing protein [Burkholderiaceae bacterium]